MFHDVKILIAEDQRINQRVLETQLDFLGYESVIAENGLVVLELLEKQKFDLILMDCIMPGLDGYETTKKIRSKKNERYSTIPIVALTGNHLKEERLHCFTVGMDGYLEKPVQIDDLKKSIDNTMSSIAVCKKNDDIIVDDSIDWHYLCELELIDSGQSSLAKEVVTLFRRNSLEKVSSIQTALQSRNTKDIVTAAHALKSASSYVGAMKVQVLCSEIQVFAQQSKLDEASFVLNQLTVELSHVLKLLSIYPF